MAAPNRRLPYVQDRTMWLAQDMAYFDREGGQSPFQRLSSSSSQRTPSFLQMFLDERASPNHFNPPPTPRISPRPLETSTGNSQENRNYRFPIVDNLPPNVQFQNGQYRRDQFSEEDRQVLREFLHTPGRLPRAVIGPQAAHPSPRHSFSWEAMSPSPRNLPPRMLPPKYLPPRNFPPRNMPPATPPPGNPPNWQLPPAQQPPMVVTIPPPKPSRAEKARMKYAAMTEEERQEYNRRRYASNKIAQVKLKERKQLEALLMASNDIQHDREAEKAAVLRVRRARWANKSKKHYQQKTPEERKEFNQQKLIRKIHRETGVFCADLKAEDKPQVVVDYLEKLRIEHNEKQLRRYHALTAEKKKERNKKKPGQRKKKAPKPKPQRVIPDCVLEVIEDLRSQAVDKINEEAVK